MEKNRIKLETLENQRHFKVLSELDDATFRPKIKNKRR